MVGESVFLCSNFGIAVLASSFCQKRQNVIAFISNAFSYANERQKLPPCVTPVDNSLGGHFQHSRKGYCADVIAGCCILSGFGHDDDLIKKA